MKNLLKTFSVIGSIALLSACGNQNLANPGLTTVNNQGMNGGVMTGPNGQQCIPLQSGSIPFTIQGAQISNTQILGGTLPQGSRAPGAQGQVMLGQQGAGGGIQYMPKQSYSGMLQISLGQGQNGVGVVSGMIQLQPFISQQIMMNFGGGMFGNPMYGNFQQNTQNPQAQSVCITSIGLDIVHQNMAMYQTGMWNQGYQMPQMGGQGQIIQALVYITLSNNQTVGPFNF